LQPPWKIAGKDCCGWINFWRCASFLRPGNYQFPSRSSRPPALSPTTLHSHRNPIFRTPQTTPIVIITMADAISVPMMITSCLISFGSGFLFGCYAVNGYIIPPSWRKERDANWKDPVESDESDIDEADTVLDHAPNWSNGEEADRRQGLRAPKAPTTKAPAVAPKSNEECKLVLVVRTDLGMTKGMCSFRDSNVWSRMRANPPQGKSPRNADTRHLHATRPSLAPPQKNLNPPRLSCFDSGSVWGRPRSLCRSRARTRCWS
jgi:hypothetical protein